ncbi:MAG: DUF6291 domain-containing protein [Muribaculaceae bacterium]|nr:DUF6291 domain-containing protein [Muribaculaceae bacterium]
MQTIADTKRDSFVFYRSFFDVIKLLDPNQAKTLMIAIGEYALDGIEPDLAENTLKVAWLPIKPQLEANRRRYENGHKGGAPKGSKNNPSGRKGKGMVSDAKIINETAPGELTVENIDAPDLVKIVPPNSNNAVTTRCIPTQSEVKSYIEANALKVDPREFYLYYESRNWMSGSNPLYNWQAMAQTWHHRVVKKEEEADSQLGVGEFIDSNGNRTYGKSGVIVPMDAPRRPSAGHWWNLNTVQWEKYA